MDLKEPAWKVLMAAVMACVALGLVVATVNSSGVKGATGLLTILYVEPGGTGDCTSWAEACTLQDALGTATSGTEIWVAAGMHLPAAADRTATFQLESGVAVYGGFAGSETAREERDWVANLTVLSGDIATGGASGDNSYHVVTGSGVDSTAVLDGFTITGGNANGTEYPHYEGGGMLNSGASPTLTNLTFRDNDASYGGGMHNSGGGPVLTNVIFSGNSAGYGGAMYNSNSNAAVTNVTFSGNSAGQSGGAMYNWGGSPTVANSILWGNTATSGSQIHNVADSTPTISYSLVQDCGDSGPDWESDCGADGTHNLDADPQFVDDDLSLQLSSPAIDAGNNAAVPVGITVDLAGHARFVDVPTVADSGAGTPPIVDMGAYEALMKTYLPLVMKQY
jgi:hypothetical protein